MKSEVARYRSFDTVYLPMGQSQQLVYSPLTGESRLMADASARILQECRTAATLHAHTASLCGRLGLREADAPAVRRQLEELVASGMLVSEKSLVERCIDHVGELAVTPPISTVGIYCCDRLANLGTCLAGFAAVSSELGRATRFLIVDASRSPDRSGDAEDAAKALKQRFGAEFHFIDVAGKLPFINRVSERAQVDPAIVRFALLNDDLYPTGTSGDRNVLLLATVGQLTMQTDGGVELNVLPGIAAKDGLTLTSVADPTSFWLEEESRIAADADAHSVDILALHERLLGKPLGMCLSGYPQESIETDGIATSFLRRLRGGGSVQLTTAGVAGDLGVESEFAAICADGVARDRLLRSANGYQRLVRAHRGIRGVSRTTITDGVFGTGGTVGLDNRSPLPPFMPGEGNQNIVFADVARATGNGLFGHLPWAIRRDGPQPPDHPRRSSIRLSSRDIVAVLSGYFERAAGAGVERNLTDLGSLLCELGTLPPRDFSELVQRTVWTRAVQKIKFLEQLLARHRGEPKFWADQITEHLSELRKALTEEDYAVPFDLSIVFGTEMARTLMQEIVLKYGQLLAVWVALRDAALELQMNGHELGRRV